MAEEEKILWINTPLRGDVYIAEFQVIKEYLGIATNADVVRYLIREQARRIGAAEEEEREAVRA